MTFYRLRMHAPVRYSFNFATKIRTAVDARGSKPRVTNVGFYSFARAEQEPRKSLPARRLGTGWESTARLLRVLASAGSVPAIGHA